MELKIVKCVWWLVGMMFIFRNKQKLIAELRHKWRSTQPSRGNNRTRFLKQKFTAGNLGCYGSEMSFDLMILWLLFSGAFHIHVTSIMCGDLCNCSCLHYLHSKPTYRKRGLAVVNEKKLNQFPVPIIFQWINKIGKTQWINKIGKTQTQDRHIPRLSECKGK